jgi:hypothetical protein
MHEGSIFYIEPLNGKIHVPTLLYGQTLSANVIGSVDSNCEFGNPTTESSAISEEDGGRAPNWTLSSCEAPEHLAVLGRIQCAVRRFMQNDAEHGYFYTRECDLHCYTGAQRFSSVPDRGRDFVPGRAYCFSDLISYSNGSSPQLPAWLTFAQDKPMTLRTLILVAPLFAISSSLAAADTDGSKSVVPMPPYNIEGSLVRGSRSAMARGIFFGAQSTMCHLRM